MVRWHSRLKLPSIWVTSENYRAGVPYSALGLSWCLLKSQLFLTVVLMGRKGMPGPPLQDTTAASDSPDEWYRFLLCKQPGHQHVLSTTDSPQARLPPASLSWLNSLPFCFFLIILVVHSYIFFLRSWLLWSAWGCKQEDRSSKTASVATQGFKVWVTKLSKNE